MKNRVNNIKTTLGYNPGGITHIWLMDINNFIGYRFKDDALSDEYLIEGIIASSGFLELDAINETNFTESVANNIYKQKLSTFIYPLTNNNIKNIIDLQKGKYLVIFRSILGQTFCFGADGGASISFTQQTGKTGGVEGYNISIEKNSSTPLYLITDNVEVKSAIKYQPVFEDGAFCQIQNGKQTGYEIASFVLKTSVEGHPVDQDGELCSNSGKAQAILLLEGFKKPIGNFVVESTYNENTKQINGSPIIRYNPLKCKAPGSFILLSRKQIIFTPSTPDTQIVDLMTNRPWSISAPDQNIALCSLGSGSIGKFNIMVNQGEVYGNENFVFRTDDGEEVMLNIINSKDAPEWVLKKNTQNVSNWNSNGVWLVDRKWE